MEIQVSHNSAIGQSDLVPVLPQIGSGTDGSTRLGDRIKPKSLVVQGYIATKSEVADNKALLVRVLLLSQKDVKVSSQVGVSTDPAHLLRTAIPASSEIPFNGNRNELLYRVNDNKFRVYMDKTFLLAPAMPATSADAAGNANVKSVIKFKYAFKDLPAHFTFDEGNGDYVNNFAPFLAIGYAYADTTGPDTVDTRIIADVYSRLAYEDA